MKKFAILLISAMLFLISVNLSAQNPNCIKDNKLKAGNLMNFTDNINLKKEEGCSFLFVLSDPRGIGWSSQSRIDITVDGVDYGSVTLPWGTPYKEEIKFLPSGEIQFLWVGPYGPIVNCFDIYNSLNELIYESPELLPGDLFFIYQNECPECIPLTHFNGEYITETKLVNLSWTVSASEYLTGFDIFRNNELLEHVAPTTDFYSENTKNLEPGNYKYCVVPVYPFACTFEDECFTTDINVGIDTYSTTLYLFPNPTSNFINILGEAVSEVRIYNNLGQLLLTQSSTNVINVSDLTNGIYMLSVATSTGNTIQKKIIINR
jgi:hypothetical protein